MVFIFWGFWGFGEVRAAHVLVDEPHSLLYLRLARKEHKNIPCGLAGVYLHRHLRSSRHVLCLMHVLHTTCTYMHAIAAVHALALKLQNNQRHSSYWPGE
jgi:hypothetical protein